MQVNGTRMFRVKAVAAMFDVSPSTIYRAIEAGQLGAVRIGTGRGAIRVPESELAAFRAAVAVPFVVPAGVGAVSGAP